MAVDRRSGAVIGVDLGGTKILTGVVSPEGRILGRSKRSTPAKEGGDAIVGAMIEGVDEALEDADMTKADLAGVGVGSPGPLDTERGVILFSANLNVRDFPLGPILSRTLGLPVVLRNDVRAGGYGEFRLGAGRGYRNVLSAFVGTGIGGCVILNGAIVEGLTGNAGEVGHMIVKANGAKCGCGRRGCLEALASRSAIARRLVKAQRKGVATPLAAGLVARSEKIKSRELAAAFAANDPVVVQEVERAARYLGLGLGSLINLLGPEIVIIGGGVAEALGEPYLDLVRRAARGQALVDPEGRTPIVLAALGDDAGILGASLMTRERLAS